ncbi:MAG TPA: TonB-dependent receptor plug domain-containing protein, partial [Cellvibrio sp.]|nr:TonB-dependent receptor plug domain-containing protein [Cellvibrio sp.]
MYKTISFKKKLLTTAIASAASFGGVVYAQDGTVEEVMVTGIRASVVQAMDTKRNAVGVVDAISAEDIGKMPDSNLAESLQRITGLSINRSDGEGSQVTARGIGAELNMVTLNGRVMPAVKNGETGDAATRAYDFANLAS